MKKIIYLFCLLAISFTSCQSQGQSNDNTDATAQQATPAYIDLTVADFKAKMANPDIVVIDVRTPEEIAEGKIEGALEMDFRADGFAEGLDGLDKEKTYLVYCKSGGRSSNTCNMMSGKGFKKLYNLEGGYTAWTKEK